jgi:phosphopantothenoylcysteine decarboxylase/phosphopantothenate--cysteine ligase
MSDSDDIAQDRTSIMASLTVRKLDDAIKTGLRLRAARNGRSVEDEVRVILRAAATASSSDVVADDRPYRNAAISRKTNNPQRLVKGNTDYRRGHRGL